MKEYYYPYVNPEREMVLKAFSLVGGIKVVDEYHGRVNSEFLLEIDDEERIYKVNKILWIVLEKEGS